MISNEIMEQKTKLFKKGKSRAEYLRQWRIKNRERSKTHSRKNSRNYYRKNRQKYLDREKIKYHEYCITSAIPRSHFCEKCDDLAGHVADHECFKGYLPAILWIHRSNHSIDEKQIEINKKFVSNLQNQGRIPKFKIHDTKTYLNRIQYGKKFHDLVLVLASRKHNGEGIDYSKEFSEFDKRMEECFSKD